MMEVLTISAEAIRFVQLLNNDALIASAFQLAIGDAVRSPEPDAAMQAWFLSRGFSTSMTDVLAALEDSHQNDLGLWCARYELVDEAGVTHQLTVHSRERISLDGQPCSAFNFRNKTLTWTPTHSQTTAGSLVLHLSAEGFDPDVDAPSLVGLTATGTLTLAGQSPKAVRGGAPRLALGTGEADQPPKSLAPFNGTYTVALLDAGKSQAAADFVLSLDGANAGSITFGFQLTSGCWTRPGDNGLKWNDAKGHGTRGDILFSELNGKKRFEGYIWTGETAPIYPNAIGTFVDPAAPKPAPDPLDQPVVSYTNTYVQTGIALLGSVIVAIGAGAFPLVWKKLEKWNERRREAAERGESLAPYDMELRDMRPTLEVEVARQQRTLQVLERATTSQFVTQSEMLERLSSALEREARLLEAPLARHEQLRAEAERVESRLRESLSTAEQLLRDAEAKLERSHTEENERRAEERRAEHEKARQEHIEAEERAREERERHEDLKERHDHMKEAHEVMRRR